jgi:hypothetical protein
VAAPEAKPLADKPPARPVGTFVPLVTDDAPSEPPRERTKTMPLPPEPGESLKLLAELTNTPPPRETALRTIARRFKIWTPLVLLLLIIFGAVQALRPLPSPELKLTSASSHTFDGSEPSLPWPGEGQAVVEVEGLGSLGSSGKEKAVPIASVAKVMTAYVILRDHPIKSGAQGETITVDQKAEDQYESGSAEQESGRARYSCWHGQWPLWRLNERARANRAHDSRRRGRSASRGGRRRESARRRLHGESRCRWT